MRAGVLLDRGVDEQEFIYPYYRLIEEGFDVDIISVEKGTFISKNGLSLASDTSIENALPKKYQVLIIPGGYAPDRLRRSQSILELVRKVYEHGGRIGAICHGPQVLISAGIISKLRITGFSSIKDDLINAGAIYTGTQVESEKRIVSCVGPNDMPELMKVLLKGF